jgi:hypothetical protein
MERRMARKKPRTPPPPTRRPQGPKERKDGKRKPAAAATTADRNRMLLYAFSAAGIVGLVVVIAVVALAGGGGAKANVKQVSSLMAAANCTFKSVKGYVPPGQHTHVNSLTAKLPWNTSPPSNGQHYPEWAVWGFYTVPVNPRQVVHNEEHGGVVLWWGPKVPQTTVAKLQSLYDSDGTGMFGTPYAQLGSKVAITAWTGNPSHYQQDGDFGTGHIAICPHYTAATEKAFVAFRDAFRGHGPEGIPLSQDKPGMGPGIQ